jgi:hypothetical protein
VEGVSRSLANSSRMTTGRFHGPLAILVVGLLLMALNFPYKARGEGLLNQGPTGTTQADIQSRSPDAPQDGKDTTNFATTYQFVANQRLYKGESNIALKEAPANKMSVTYLLADPSINQLTGASQSSWNFFFLSSLVVAAGGIWLVMAFVKVPDDSTRKSSRDSGKRARKRKKRSRKKR